jgi:hypothetical protein
MFEANRLSLLMNDLRAAGYRVDVDCEVRILALLAWWSTQSKIPASSAQLINWLSPLVSASETQQKDFPAHFEHWFGTWQAADPQGTEDKRVTTTSPMSLPIKSEPEVAPEPPTPSSGDENAARRVRGRTVLIVVVVISVMLALGYLLVRNFPRLAVGPIQIDTAAPSKERIFPTPPGFDYIIELLQRIEVDLGSPWPAFTLGATVLLASLAIALLRTRYSAARFRYFGGVPRATFNLFLQSALISERDRRQQRFRGLSRFLSVPSDSLDLRRTIDRSISQGGLFVPVYATKKIVPEYDVLIDRVRASDHLAHLFREYANSLVSAGTHCNIWYFHRDPRQCFDVDGRRSSLAARGRLGAARRLIIMSDGSGLFDPVTGKPGAWILDIEGWTDRVILTPRHPALWSEREAMLSEQVPIRVVPAIGNWIELLAASFGDIERIGVARRGSHDDPAGMRDLFALLADRPFRWTDQSHPNDEVIEMLTSGLENGLDKATLRWLSACAVYPVLAWHMTLAIGRGILDGTGRPLLTEQRLLILSQLPWFRRGSMPVWLREVLIAGMTDAQYEEIRAFLEGGLSLLGGWDADRLPLRVTLGAIAGDPTQTTTHADVTLLDFVRRRPIKGVDLLMARRTFDAFLPKTLNDEGKWPNPTTGLFAIQANETSTDAISTSHAGLCDRLGNEWMAATTVSSSGSASNFDASEWRPALFLNVAGNRTSD